MGGGVLATGTLRKVLNHSFLIPLSDCSFSSQSLKVKFVIPKGFHCHLSEIFTVNIIPAVSKRKHISLYLKILNLIKNSVKFQTHISNGLINTLIWKVPFRHFKSITLKNVSLIYTEGFQHHLFWWMTLPCLVIAYSFFLTYSHSVWRSSVRLLHSTISSFSTFCIHHLFSWPEFRLS